MKKTVQNKCSLNNTSVLLHPDLQTLLQQKFLQQKLDTSNFSNGIIPPKMDHQSSSHNKKRTNSTVDPIKDLIDVQIAKDYFLNQAIRYKNNPNNIRNYMLFVIGINCARRIGDLVTLTYSDFLNDDLSWKEHLNIAEQKTDKPIKIKINSAIKEAIIMYLTNKPSFQLTDYLFQSRDGNNVPLNTRTFSRILKEMSRDTGLDKKYNISTHSMRKTWAYHYYIKHPTEIVKIQKALNHSSPQITLRYIGLDQKEMDKMFEEIVL